MWELSFIAENDFKEHIRDTIKQYGEKLNTYDLNKFNKNIVDPIKLIFDKMVYNYSWESVVINEIARQRDKSNNNDIGYFHQKIFRHIKGCTVPKAGWDVIFTNKNGIEIPECGRVGTVYVEMKNKHNTMNSAASGKTYIKMQGQLLDDDDCACCLVEAIARRSQNIAWEVTVDGKKQKHRRIRRVSMDKFYALVTGEQDAFYKMCMALPGVIEQIIVETKDKIVPQDTVIEELKKIADERNGSFALALYLLGFGTYDGFR